MNLRGKISGLLCLLVVAVISISCEDETSLLGYQNPNKKFRLNYVELSLPASSFVVDSLRSSNLSTAFFGFTDFSRLLVGRYTDPVFGTHEAKAFMRYAPFSSDSLPPTAIYDSIAFEMMVDYYYYGEKAEKEQKFYLHEMTENLDYSGDNDYYTNSEVDYDPTPLGEGSLLVSATVFDTASLNNAAKFRRVLRIPVADDLGTRIFEVAQNNPGNALDTFSVYWESFKGLVLKPDATNDRIVGFAPGNTYSKMIVYYHVDTVQKEYRLSYSSVGGFSNITSDRTGTPLEGLVKYQSEVRDNRCYIQAGSGILTALDLSPFYEFAAADSNKNILFNNVELLISGVETPGNYAPPATLGLAVLKPNNRFYLPANESDSLAIGDFGGTLTRYDFYAYSVSNDGGYTTGSLNYTSSSNKYNGMFTAFFQRLLVLKDERQYPNFALFPYSSKALASSADNRYETSKSLNRTLFPANGIKLRLYYTRPTLIKP